MSFWQRITIFVFGQLASNLPKKIIVSKVTMLVNGVFLFLPCLFNHVHAQSLI